jgi:hypothetical protein
MKAPWTAVFHSGHRAFRGLPWALRGPCAGLTYTTDSKVGKISTMSARLNFFIQKLHIKFSCHIQVTIRHKTQNVRIESFDEFEQGEDDHSINIKNKPMELAIKIPSSKNASILGAYAKSRKAFNGFVMPVRLSVRPFAWNNSAPTERIFIKFHI